MKHLPTHRHTLRSPYAALAVTRFANGRSLWSGRASSTQWIYWSQRPAPGRAAGPMARAQTQVLLRTLERSSPPRRWLLELFVMRRSRSRRRVRRLSAPARNDDRATVPLSQDEPVLSSISISLERLRFPLLSHVSGGRKVAHHRKARVDGPAQCHLRRYDTRAPESLELMIRLRVAVSTTSTRPLELNPMTGGLRSPRSCCPQGRLRPDLTQSRLHVVRR